MPASRGRRRLWRQTARSLRSQTALTLVETMVAAALLLVGLLGTVKLIDVASSSQGDSKAQEGATNLARELLEDAHDTAYKQIGTSGWITSAMAGLSNDSGSANTVTTPTGASARTTLTRRGTSYTATVSWCSVDDSKDSYGNHSSSVTWCSDSNSTGSGDPAPEDLKRITANISYSVNGKAKTLAETITLSATGGAVAPTVSSLCASGQPIAAIGSETCTNPLGTITDSSYTTQAVKGYSPGAADMKFTVNGTEVTSGVTNNGDGSWTYTWPLAGLTDGTYTIGAIAVDALGNRSQTVTRQVKLARGGPLTAQNIVGGYNYVNPTGPSNGGTEVVELQWDANAEGSVTGYEVLRGATSVCGGQSDLTTSCIDTSPPTSGGTVTTYTIKTWYQDADGNAQSVSTTYNVTAPGAAVASQYWLSASFASPTTHCDTGLGGFALNSTAPTGTLDLTTNATTLGWCSPALPSGATLGAGTATVDLWVTNSNNKTCSTFWWISHNASPSSGGTQIGSTGTYTAPGNSTTKAVSSISVPATTLVANDQINLFIDIDSASGNCSKMVLRFGSSAHASDLQMPSLTGGGTPLTVPNAPSGLTVTPNGDGTTTLNWTAPTSSSTVPAPDFYRIYRDGTAISNRVDTTDAINTTVSSATSAGATTLNVASTTGYSAGQTVLVDTGANQDVMTISSISGNTITFTGGMAHAHAANVPVVLRSVTWTDTSTGGTSHTYRVSATSANLAESPFSPSAGVTG